MKKALLLFLTSCMVGGVVAQTDTLGKCPFFFYGAPIETGYHDSVYCEVYGFFSILPEDLRYTPSPYIGEGIYSGSYHDFVIKMYSEDTVHIVGFALGYHGCSSPFKLAIFEDEGFTNDEEPLVTMEIPRLLFCWYTPIDSNNLYFLEVPGWSSLETFGLPNYEWGDPRNVWLSFFEEGEGLDVIGDFYLSVSKGTEHDYLPDLLFLTEHHASPYHFPYRPVYMKINKNWVYDTLNHSFPMVFPIVEPRCEAVEEVRVTTDSAGCLVAEWDSLPRQEQWVVALNIEGQTATVLDTVNACHWQYCALPAGTPYQIGVRSRCTNLRSYSWSKWNAPIDVSIKAVVPEETFLVAPNPTTGVVRLQLPPSAAHDSRAEVYSADGRHMATYRLPMLSTTATLDLSALPSGLYLLRLTTPQGMYSQKVLLR